MSATNLNNTRFAVECLPSLLLLVLVSVSLLLAPLWSPVQATQADIEATIDRIQTLEAKKLETIQASSASNNAADPNSDQHATSGGISAYSLSIPHFLWSDLLATFQPTNKDSYAHETPHDTLSINSINQIDPSSIGGKFGMLDEAPANQTHSAHAPIVFSETNVSELENNNNYPVIKHIVLESGPVNATTTSKQSRVSFSVALTKLYKFQSLITKSSLGRKQPTKQTSKNRVAARAQPSPVVLVPGFGGSRLEARLSKKNTVHYFCDSSSDWFDIWINVKMLLPYMIDCFIDDIRLKFDYATNTTKSEEGVEIRVKNDTSLYNVEYLHSLQISGFAYMAPIVNKLLERKEESTSNSSHENDNQPSSIYEREVNLIGAPYDFRKAPNELGEYFESLSDRVEELSSQSNQKVTLICHSMGCTNMLFFLQRKSQAWKDKHIRRLISIAAPWGGCTGALKATARGDNLGMPFLLSESKLNQIQRTLPSTIYLFPNEKVFGNTPLITANASFLYKPESSGTNIGSQNKQSVESSIPKPPSFVDSTIPSFISSVFVSSPMQQTLSIDTDKNEPDKSSSLNGASFVGQKSLEPVHYTAQNLELFFRDINHRDGYYMWLNTNKLLNDLEAPGVEVHCLVGRGFRTLSKIDFMGQVPNSESVEHFEDGDGTVSIQSASYCKQWVNQQSNPVVYKEFNVNHIESLKSPEVTNYIGEIISD